MFVTCRTVRDTAVRNVKVLIRFFQQMQLSDVERKNGQKVQHIIQSFLTKRYIAISCYEEIRISISSLDITHHKLVGIQEVNGKIQFSK